jgi:hypothetical protein
MRRQLTISIGGGRRAEDLNEPNLKSYEGALCAIEICLRFNPPTFIPRVALGLSKTSRALLVGRNKYNPSIRTTFGRPFVTN